VEISTANGPNRLRAVSKTNPSATFDACKIENERQSKLISMPMTFDLFAPFSALAHKLLPVESGTDGAHDTSHLARVWRNVQQIQHEEGGDLEILAAAVLLHDCVQVPKDSPLRSQASRLAGAEATIRLNALGWSKQRTDWAASAIESHSYSAGIPPATLEASILQDADRLDAIGFIGIARCFYTSGRMGSSLYESADPRGERRTLNDAAFALDHFPAKLLKVAEGFRTATGRLIAAQRDETVRSFYLGMLHEVE
jgi:uncharacterized protein